MRFEALRALLIAHIRERVANGDFTQRGLARRAGISQPHLNHLLNGGRTLTPEAGDRLLDALGVSILDLLQPGETPSQRASAFMLDGLLGPGRPFPQRMRREERYWAPAVPGAPPIQPVLAMLAGDSAMQPLFRAGDVALLDQSPSRRALPQPEGIYAIEWKGEALLRRVRFRNGALHVACEAALEDASRWERAPLSSVHVLELIRAEAVWIGPAERLRTPYWK